MMRFYVFMILMFSGVFSTQTFAKDNSEVVVVKPPQIILPFEKLDVDSNEILTKSEIQGVYATVYEEELNRNGFAPMAVKFGNAESSKSSAPEKPNLEFTKNDFVEANVASVFEKDSDANGEISVAEYGIKNDYDYSEAECKEIVSKNENAPKRFGDVVNAIKNGESAEVSFCTKKYNLN